MWMEDAIPPKITCVQPEATHIDCCDVPKHSHTPQVIYLVLRD